MPTQNRRTVIDGGSKCSIGVVSHCSIGSPPATCSFQKRSISTSHSGRSPVLIRSYCSRTA